MLEIIRVERECLFDMTVWYITDAIFATSVRMYIYIYIYVNIYIYICMYTYMHMAQTLLPPSTCARTEFVERRQCQVANISISPFAVTGVRNEDRY